MAADEIRIGVMATSVGPLSRMGEEGVRGADLAIAEFGGQVAGKKIVRIKESTNATPDSAITAAETLLNRHKADFTIGPVSGNEGLAIRDFALAHPHQTFMNGVAAGQDMTLRSPAPNFFNFATNGVQWMAGLAEYVYEVQGYKRIATLAEDYSYPHSQIAGFILPYCSIGGTVAHKFWVALGTSNYLPVISAMPPDIDAILVALAGADAVHFLQQYDQLGGKVPLIGGSTTIDQTVLNTRGDMTRRLVGTASSGSIADNNTSPEWQTFVASYRAKFPQGLPSPSLGAYGYYVNTKAALLALQAIDGTLADDQQLFQETLRTLEFDAPTGRIRLDHNRQAIANNFVTVVAQQPDGKLYSQLVKTVTDVNQTLGIPEDDYLQIGPFNRDNPPACL